MPVTERASSILRGLAVCASFFALLAWPADSSGRVDERMRDGCAPSYSGFPGEFVFAGKQAPMPGEATVESVSKTLRSAHDDAGAWSALRSWEFFLSTAPPNGEFWANIEESLRVIEHFRGSAIGPDKLRGCVLLEFERLVNAASLRLLQAPADPRGLQAWRRIEASRDGLCADPVLGTHFKARYKSPSPPGDWRSIKRSYVAMVDVFRSRYRAVAPKEALSNFEQIGLQVAKLALMVEENERGRAGQVVNDMEAASAGMADAGRQQLRKIAAEIFSQKLRILYGVNLPMIWVEGLSPLQQLPVEDSPQTLTVSRMNGRDGEQIAVPPFTVRVEPYWRLGWPDFSSALAPAARGPAETTLPGRAEAPGKADLELLTQGGSIVAEEKRAVRAREGKMLWGMFAVFLLACLFFFVFCAYVLPILWPGSVAAPSRNCPACSFANRPVARFCGECGAALASPGGPP